MEQAERDQVLRLLTESRDFLCQTVAGLSADQQAFKPGADRWSIADCVEHTAVVESTILAGIERALSAPAPAERAQAAVTDQFLLDRVPTRSTRIQGPPGLMPSGRWVDCDGSVDAFRSVRERTVEFAASTDADLRAYSFPHPVFGAMDCYQWLLAVAGHCERHVHQMEEIKASPGFPASAGSAQA
ncbi:MAG TPA: DinB family protein [Bryobacteraceae bacterium]|nr:DinB family protein [Bryobacteraceae bacterium]